MGVRCFIELPGKIKGKRSLLNIKNEDEKCLAWCIAAHRFRQKTTQRTLNPHRTSHYNDELTGLNTDNVNFPASLTDVCRFSKEFIRIFIDIRIFTIEKIN